MVRTYNSCNSIDPFEAQSLPTSVRATLEPQEQGAIMVLARFDTTGRFVAAGLRDGRAWLWDLETQAVVRHFEGHVKMVTGLSYVSHILAGVVLNCFSFKVVTEFPFSPYCFARLEYHHLGFSIQNTTSSEVQDYALRCTNCRCMLSPAELVGGHPHDRNY